MPFSFSRLGVVAIISYANSPMLRPTKATKLEVQWETIPEADHYAFIKAVALVLRRKAPLSTGVDLTRSPAELMCERQP